MKQNLQINLNILAGIVLLLSAFAIDQSCAKVNLALASQSPVYGLLLKLANQNGTKDLCHDQMEKMFYGIENKDRWALKMLDASGSPVHGFYWGNNDWISSKRQCIATSYHTQLQVSEKWRPAVKEGPDSITPFPVQLFAAYIRHNTTMQISLHWQNDDLITLTLCLPNSCTTEQVSLLLQQYLEDKHLAIQNVYNATLQLEYVKTTISDGQWIWDTKLLLIICSIVFLFTLSIAGTWYDIKLQNKRYTLERKRKLADYNNHSYTNGYTNGHIPSPPAEDDEITNESKFLLAFSIPRNCKGTFVTEVPPNGIPQIHGMRFLSMVFIVGMHGALYGLDFTMNRPLVFWQGLYNPVIQIIGNATIHVDTFLTFGISVCGAFARSLLTHTITDHMFTHRFFGILLSYIFFTDEQKRIKRGGNPNQSLFRRVGAVVVGTLKRYLRLTPAYLIAIGVAILSSTFTYNTSPRWTNERSDLVCSEYWWRNVLYINNMYPRSEMCLSWSWYLSNDMQFLVVALILCTIALYSEKVALYLTCGIITASTAATWYFSYSINFVPFYDELFVQLEHVYDPPWMRITPYLIGAITGCILANHREKLNFSQKTIRNLWIACILSFAVCTVALTDRDISAATAATFLAFSRVTWGLAVSWVVIACFIGQGGYVNSVLSYNGWIPLSRLTYCCYLINPILIYAIYSYSDISVSQSIVQVGFYGLAFVAITFAAAVVPVLLVEVPSMKLLKYFFDPYLVNSKPKTSAHKFKSEDVMDNSESEKSDENLHSETLPRTKIGNDGLEKYVGNWEKIEGKWGLKNRKTIE